jgi:hypothetical protein
MEMEMNKVYIFLGIMCILILCTSCINKNDSILSESTYEFVKGKWIATRQSTDIYGPYQEQFFVKFINHSSLWFCHKDPIDQFCDKFKYKAITDDLLLVENNRATGGNWKLKIDNDKLDICIWDDTNCITFTRDKSGYKIFLELFGIYR